MMFSFVAKHRGIWPVALICEALGVSRSGFYAWLTREPSDRVRRDVVLTREVRRSFLDSDRTYGARRVWHDVLAAGFCIGLHAIERLMRLNALKARPRRRRLPADTGVRPLTELPANILDRQFDAVAPNRKWVADFTYIWTAEGWLYVAVVLDLYSRRIVGWSIACHRRARDGDLAARTAERAAASFRSRQPVHERAVPAADGRARRPLQSVALGQRLGQCCRGELLLHAQDRADGAQDLPIKG